MQSTRLSMSSLLAMAAIAGLPSGLQAAPRRASPTPAPQPTQRTTTARAERSFQSLTDTDRARIQAARQRRDRRALRPQGVTR